MERQSEQQPPRDDLALFTTDVGPLLHVQGCEHIGPGTTREPTTRERQGRSICGRCQRELDGVGRRCFGTDLDAAMRFLGTQLSAQSRIRQTLSSLDHDLLWVPPSKTYIAVRWRGRAAGWIHHGHIGVSDGRRIELPGYRDVYRAGGAGTAPRWGATCPQCQLKMPLTGVCDDCA